MTPENYITLMPDVERVISIEAYMEILKGGVEVLLKQYSYNEKNKRSVKLWEY